MLEILSSIPFMDGFQLLDTVTTTSFCSSTVDIWRFVGKIVFVLKIVIPVIIVLLATIDLGKAVMAGEDKKIKEAQKMLLMRLVYGVAIFFVVTIVQVVFGLVAGGDSGDGIDDSACLQCIADNGNC